MPQLFHKTFADALTGANGFDSVSATNGTIEQSAGAGLNGTTGGVTVTRTANSPNVFGTSTQDFTGKNILRTAWWTDLSNLTITATGVNESVALYTFRNAAASRNPLILYYRRLAAGYQYRHRCINDGSDVSNEIVTPNKPAWIEARLKRESVDGAADGESQLWFGGGDYPALGELVSTLTGLDNFIVFEVDKHLMGLRAGAASVQGSILLDEWTLQDSDEPILFGVEAEPEAEVLTPDPVVMQAMVPALSLSLGAVSLTPDPVVMTVAIPDPAIVTGGHGLTPQPVSFIIQIPDPLLVLGVLRTEIFVSDEQIGIAEPVHEQLVYGLRI